MIISINSARYCDAYRQFLGNRRHTHQLLNKFKRYCGIENLMRQRRLQPPLVHTMYMYETWDVNVVDERRWIIARLKYNI